MILGIIGEAGTGKTTATAFFAKYGAYVIYSDKIVKEIHQQEATKQAIIKTFGDGFVQTNGEINKRMLREKSFSDRKFLQQLEMIIWPEMIKKIKEEMVNNQDKDLVVLDCAVLFNAGLDKDVDKFLLIESDDKLKSKRIQERDDVTEESALATLSLQKEHLILKPESDFLIANNDTLPVFLHNLQKVLTKITN